MRGQNRHMRNFIDGNQHLLVKDIIACHCNRIHTEHKLLTDLADCDIIDVLHRYCSHYGEFEQIGTLKREAVGAALGGNWNRVKDTRLSTGRLLFSFCILRRIPSPYRRPLRLPYKEIASATHQPLSQKDQDAFREKFESTSWADHDVAYPERPSIFLTTQALYKCRPDDRILGHRDARDPVFHEVLGLPLLDADNSLAFCSHRFETMVVLMDEIVPGSLTVLQRAGGLEDIYVW